MFTIFMNSEINEIDLVALFSKIFKVPTVNLELQVNMCFALKISLKVGQILQRPIFKFHKK